MSDEKEKVVDDLAQAAGIEPGYRDAWGKWVEVPREIKSEILQAIGFDISTAAAAEEELIHFESRYRRSPLRPVTVVWQSALPAAISVTVPLNSPGSWRLSIDPEPGNPESAESEPRRRIDLMFNPRDYGQREIITAPSGDQAVLRILIGDGLACGYHRVTLALDQPGTGPTGTISSEAEASGTGSIVAQSLLIVAPDHCYLPPSLLPENKVFGVGVQIPSLCSHQDLGAGDLGQLRSVIKTVAGWGGSFVGVNPVHAVSYRDAGSISPYSPESRSCFSPLLINIESAAKFLGIERSAAAAEDLIDQAEELRVPDLVNHRGVWQLKRKILQQFFKKFSNDHRSGDSPLGRLFETFCREALPPLIDYVAYRAIQESLEETDPSIWGWPVWPEELRDRHSAAVAARIAAEQERVNFHFFLQWIVDRQLEECSAECRDAGMPIGLYLDLALGSSMASSDIWANRDLYALNASLGAPPDMLNVLGQGWGLPPLVPFFLDYAAYGPLIEAIRANMRYAGAVRIDHFMSLLRLYWIPRGRTPAEGVYLRYPFQDILGILALESQRNQCLIIGEDLGTVPDGLREEMERRSILSYKVLPFIKADDGKFIPPRLYPRKALVASGTHDMATVRGWWQGVDIDNWQRFDLLRPPLTADGMRSDRQQEKAQLVQMLKEEGAGEFDPAAEDVPPGLIAAVTSVLAAAPALLQVVQAEDLFSEREQVNVPGTVDQHPNWRRRIPLPVESWSYSDAALSVIEGLGSRRRSGKN